MASRLGWLYFGEHDKACTSQPPFLCSCMIFGIQTANPLWCVTTDATETWGIWRTPESWFKWQTSGVQMVCSATNMWIWLVIANTWFVEDSQVFPQWEMRNLSWIHREYVLFFSVFFKQIQEDSRFFVLPIDQWVFRSSRNQILSGWSLANKAGCNMVHDTQLWEWIGGLEHVDYMFPYIGKNNP